MLQFPAISELKEDLLAQPQDWKLLLVPRTDFCHIPAPRWAWATSLLYGKEMQEAALVRQRPSLSSALMASETQAMSQPLLCLEVVEVLF